ncbi:MAG: 50S ribosomal protein L29 [Patescibacteria group bacterium]
MSTFAKHSVEDLQKEIAEKREALRKFRFGSAGTRARNVREGRNLRKEIARMMTELNARKLASAKESA